MADLWKELSGKVKELAGTWTAYTTLGSFTLYLLGYLSLRFHLTAIGIGTDLSVFDERYLFAGAKFLVYLVSSVPIVVLSVLVLVSLVYIPYRIICCIVPGRITTKLSSIADDRWERVGVWWSNPNRLTLIGIILSVVMIQFVMRQCFIFSNLLLAPSLPEPEWLRSILLSRGDGFRSLYFAGLVAGTAMICGIFTFVREREGQNTFSRLLVGLLAFLITVQFLMLPVNYGILIVDKVIPKVASLDGQKDLDKGQEAWLVWEGKDGVTFLVRGREAGKETRMLVALRRNDIKETRIIAYDPILHVLFADEDKRALPQPDNEKEKTQ